MKTYKDFERMYIGSSDIASLVMVGYAKGKGVSSTMLKFGKDDSYSAYIVTGEDVTIGAHYQKVAEFKSWLKIYDDEELVRQFEAAKIIVYRAGLLGCIIQLIKGGDES